MTHKEVRQRRETIRALVPRVAMVFLLASALIVTRYAIGA